MLILIDKFWRIHHDIKVLNEAGDTEVERLNDMIDTSLMGKEAIYFQRMI